MPETWMRTDYQTEGVVALEMTVEQRKRYMEQSSGDP